MDANCSDADPLSPGCNGGDECQRNHDNAVRSGRIDFQQVGRSVFSINSEIVYVSGHASTDFDKDGVSSNAVRALATQANRSNIPVVSLGIMFGMTEEQFLNRNNVDFYGVSSGGQHPLSLPNAKTVVVSGGYFEQCFCNTLRDVFNVTSPDRALTVVVPLEAVYIQRNDRYRPNFKNSKLMGVSTLRQIADSYASVDTFKNDLVDSFKSLIGTNRNGKNVFCPIQYNEYAANPEEFSIEIYLDEKGYGPKTRVGYIPGGAKKVKLVFASLSQAQSYMPFVAGKIEAQAVRSFASGVISDERHLETAVVKSRRIDERSDSITSKSVRYR